MSNEPTIIIGASAAGISAAREIRSIAADMPVRVFSEESHYPYYRPLLTEYIGDSGVEKKPNFYLNPESWYREKNIELNLGEKVVAIDMAARTVETASGKKHAFGRLILANGSSPFIPLKDAMKIRNVFSVRTLNDARTVHAQAGKVKKAIVIGGGLLGLEAAYSLTGKGIQVAIIELADRILPRQLDTECSVILQNIVTRKNIDLMMGKSVESITGGDVATGVKLSTGEDVPGEMVIYSIGVRPNVELAKNSGISVSRAVVVNERMETSVPGIYACGDVVEFNGKNIALWMPALRQGKVAGSNCAGKPAVFADEMYPAILNSFGTRVYSLGDICQDRAEHEYLLHMTKDMDKDHYKKMFFINEKIVGTILIGDISESQKIAAAIKSGNLYNDMVKKD
jgi:NAD(P)H-nitrite reductase large subunit